MDRGARAVGMTVFLSGIAILIFIFTVAYRMFTTPNGQLLSHDATLTGAGLGGILASILVRILLLFIMTLAGSLIASRGAHLYMGCTEDRLKELSRKE